MTLEVGSVSTAWQADYFARILGPLSDQLVSVTALVPDVFTSGSQLFSGSALASSSAMANASELLNAEVLSGLMEKELSEAVAAMARVDVFSPSFEVSSITHPALPRMESVYSHLSTVFAGVVAELNLDRQYAMFVGVLDQFSIDMGLAGSLGYLNWIRDVVPDDDQTLEFDRVLRDHWGSGESCSDLASSPHLDELECYTFRDAAGRVDSSLAIGVSLIVGTACWTSDLLLNGDRSPVAAVGIMVAVFLWMRKHNGRERLE